MRREPLGAGEAEVGRARHQIRAPQIEGVIFKEQTTST